MLVLAAAVTLSSTAAAAAAQNLDYELINGCDANSSSACGGNGICDATTRTCACEAFWSTSSDFIRSEADCATNVIGIYVLWSLLLLEIIWVAYTTFYIVAARFELFWDTRKKNPNATLWKNKGLCGLLFYAVVGMPSQVAMCIYRLVYPTPGIAFELLPTILFLTGKIGLYGTSMLVQGPLLNAVLKGNTQTKCLVKFNYAASIIASSVSILVGVFPFITMGAFPTNVAKQIEMMRAYYFVQAAFLAITGMQARLVKRFIFQALDRTNGMLSSNKTDKIKSKISGLQDPITNQGLLQALVYCLMGSIPFFINKHAYFLPISWLGKPPTVIMGLSILALTGAYLMIPAMPFLWKRLAYQVELDRGNVKTIMARLGLAGKEAVVLASSETDLSKKKMNGKVRNLDDGNKHQGGDGEGDNGAFSDSFFKSSPLLSGGGSFEESMPVVVGLAPIPDVTKPTENPKFSHKKTLSDTLLPPPRDQSRNATSNASVLTKKSFMEGETRIEDVLQDGHELRKAFASFLKRKHALEYLTLFDAIESYQRETNNSRLNELGHNIVQQYVVDAGPQSVDMDYSLRNALFELDAKRKFKQNSLVELRAMCINLLQTNFYGQFLRHVENEFMEE